MPSSIIPTQSTELLAGSGVYGDSMPQLSMPIVPAAIIKSSHSKSAADNRKGHGNAMKRGPIKEYMHPQNIKRIKITEDFDFCSDDINKYTKKNPHWYKVDGHIISNNKQKQRKQKKLQKRKTYKENMKKWKKRRKRRRQRYKERKARKAQKADKDIRSALETGQFDGVNLLLNTAAALSYFTDCTTCSDQDSSLEPNDVAIDNDVTMEQVSRNDKSEND